MSDTQNQTVRAITPQGVVSTLAGVVQQPGSVDGVATQAQFHSPGGLVWDPTRNVLYVADGSNHKIRKIVLH